MKRHDGKTMTIHLDEASAKVNRQAVSYTVQNVAMVVRCAKVTRCIANIDIHITLKVQLHT